MSGAWQSTVLIQLSIFCFLYWLSVWKKSRPAQISSGLFYYNVFIYPTSIEIQRVTLVLVNTLHLFSSFYGETVIALITFVLSLISTWHLAPPPQDSPHTGKYSPCKNLFQSVLLWQWKEVLIAHQGQKKRLLKKNKIGVSYLMALWFVWKARTLIHHME